MINTNLTLTIRPIMSPRASGSLLFTLFHQQDSASGRNLRQRLCHSLRSAINQGSLQAQQSLPSSRLLASELGISRVTVEAAYSQLEAEGYLQRHTGKGTFVALSSNLVAKPRSAKMRLSPTTAPLSLRGQQRVQQAGCEDPLQPLPFAAGNADLRAFPLAQWQQLINQQLRYQGQSLLGYGDPQGYAPLRQAIADYLHLSRGVNCQPEQVLVLTSSQQALQLVAQLLLDKGDCVWMEDPGYQGAKNAFFTAGAQVQPVAVDAQGINITEALPTPKLIYVTPSHHYPTGVTLSLPRRMALIELAQQQAAWILEDDYDSEYHYDGQPIPALQGLDPYGRVIYSGTFSKVLYPSLRLAYLVLPPALVAPMTQVRNLSDGHSSQLMQAVTAAFMQQGHFAAHLRYTRQLYRSRRDWLVAQLTEKLGSQLHIEPSGGGMQLACWLPKGQEASLSRQATALGLTTPGLSALYLAPDARDGWLLGYSALTPAEISQAVDRLARIRF